MRPQREFTTRSVIVSLPLDPLLLDALLDVRSAVDHLIPDWRSHPEESRFVATKRSYPWVREHYHHLASGWAGCVAIETSATLNSWDRQLRRAKRLSPRQWDRLRQQQPRRTQLKVSLHPCLYRLRGRILDITVHTDRHVTIDLSEVPNPLFERSGAASDRDFGLTLTDRGAVFQFRVPQTRTFPPEPVGADVHMPTVDFATSD
ncbi:MAG: hypothetical protein L3K08_07210, partial [Thermoplasmata archaeon]|nr:hypothetical protein [Thermoplasmata archaeon]